MITDIETINYKYSKSRGVYFFESEDKHIAHIILPSPSTSVQELITTFFLISRDFPSS